jgi:prepilin signal peptidase PulO-like enzyme (type II secretory pathway)
MMREIMDIISYLHVSSLFIVILTLTGLVVGSFLNMVIFRLPLILDNEIRHQCQQLFEYPHTQPSAPLAAKNQTIAYGCVEKQNAKNAENAERTKTQQLNLWLPCSFCPRCHQSIPYWCNVPIFSYLFLRGRSQCCHQKIAPRYLLVELLTISTSIILGFYFGPTLKLLAALMLTWSLTALTFIDLETQLLPDKITLPVLWLGLLCNVFSVFASLTSAVLGAISGYVFCYIVAGIFKKIRKIDGLGRGDFKLLAMLGSWFGWQLLPIILFISSFSAILSVIIYAIYLQRLNARLARNETIVHKEIFNKGRSNMENLSMQNMYQKSVFRPSITPIPFGPFLSLAGLIILFCNNYSG